MKTLTIFCILLAAAGCARLDYVKVPSPTQYDNWSDAQQAKADQMKGVRYYLPRPFLSLKQSVPVAQRVAFITFNYDAQRGSYKLELPADAPTWVRRVAPANISVAQAVAAMVAGLTNAARAGTGGMQAGTTGGTNAPAATQTNAPAANQGNAPETPAQTLTASTGYINDTDPVTKLGPLFDVVYLPDMEEQYVIQSHVGFAGQAAIETRLRNGWAAEVFKQTTDNSQLIPYVIRQFQSASDTAAKIATTWLPTATLGLPPNTSLADMMKFVSKGAGGFQAGTTGGSNAPPINAQDFLGKALIFKIAEVRVAQPGLYPILKPREIKDWLKPTAAVIVGGDAELNFVTYLDQAKVPWIRPDMAFIPCPPFTVIGFNTTIDVFIAPATERIAISAAGGDSGVNKENTSQTDTKAAKMQDSIKSALLKAAKTSGLAGLKDLTDQGQGITVTSAVNGDTQIKFQAPPGSKFDNSDYVAWAKTALKIDAGVNEVKSTVAPDQSTLTLTIPEPMSQIGSGLQ